jgi:hypothetical protein
MAQSNWLIAEARQKKKRKAPEAPHLMNKKGKY